MTDFAEGEGRAKCLESILCLFRFSCECSDALATGKDLELEPFLVAFQELTLIFDTILPRPLAETVRKEALGKVAALRYAAERFRKDDTSFSSASEASTAEDSSVDSKPVGDSVRLLVVAELEAPPAGIFCRATRVVSSLAWLTRVLIFVEELIGNLNKYPIGEPSAAAMLAYHQKPLWKSHSVVTRTVFERALAYLPTREEFEASINSNTDGLIELEFLLTRHVAALVRCLPEQANLSPVN